MKQLICVFAAVFALAGCSKQADSENNIASAVEQAMPASDFASAADVVADAKNSLQWAGRYQGELPCADCTAIKTTLVLNADATYEFSSEYVGGKEKAAADTERGKFEWESGNIIRMGQGISQMRFFIAPGRVQMLEQDQSAYQSESKYILHKQ